MIKYFPAKQSHCWYTDDWHLYLFNQGYPSRRQTGMTIKRRIENPLQTNRGAWAHYTIRFEHRKKMSDNRVGRLEFAITSHRSYGMNHSRVLRSKKYIRFALCF